MKRLFIGLLVLLILTACNNNLDKDIDENIIPQTDQEMGLKKSFNQRILDSVEITNLGQLGDFEISKVVGFYDKFGTDFKKTGDLESMFSCNLENKDFSNYTTPEFYKNCSIFTINIPLESLSFYVYSPDGEIPELNIASGDIQIDDYILSSYIIPDGETFESQIKERENSSKDGFCVFDKDPFKYFSVNGDYLFYGSDKLNQNPDLLYTNYDHINNYSGDVLEWIGFLGANLNNLISEEKAYAYDTGIMKENIDGGISCFGEALTFWTQKMPNIYFELNNTGNNNNTLAVDGLFSPALSIDINNASGSSYLK